MQARAPRIQGFIDNNTDLHGHFINDIKIYAPSDCDNLLSETIDAIILSTDTFQEAMKKQCHLYFPQLRVVDLYANNFAMLNTVDYTR
jgi:hypothetical protein